MATREVVIPAGRGSAFELAQGQTLRVIENEGPQAADCVFINATDHRESFHVGQTMALNLIAGTGSLKQVSALYSKPPFERVIAEIVEDTTQNHFVWNGACCSPAIYAAFVEQGWMSREQAAGHRSCFRNLADACAQFDVDPVWLGDAFNAFVNNDDEETLRRRTIAFKTPAAKRGDSIAFRAAIDLVVAVSACPDEGPVNGFLPKSLRVQVI